MTQRESLCMPETLLEKWRKKKGLSYTSRLISEEPTAADEETIPKTRLVPREQQATDQPSPRPKTNDNKKKKTRNGKRD